MLLSSGDNFPHLIQKRRSQLGFVTYLLNYPRISDRYKTVSNSIAFMLIVLDTPGNVTQFISNRALKCSYSYSNKNTENWNKCKIKCRNANQVTPSLVHCVLAAALGPRFL